jgi:hypothetical protein
LTHTIFDRDFKIGFPQFFTRAYFNGRDNEVRPFKRIHVMSVRGDDEFRIPFLIQAIRKPVDNIEALRISIHEAKRGAVQFFGTQQCRESVFSK